jgi:hypothetical protein
MQRPAPKVRRELRVTKTMVLEVNTFAHDAEVFVTSV